MKTKKIILSGIFIAFGIILPMFFHTFNMAGSIFLPMHIPVLIGGFLLGPLYGGLVGLLTPILSGFMTGMPPLVPVMPIMAFELCAYGVISGFLFEKTNKIYRSGIVHTDTAEQILDIFRTHLLNHPPRYFGDIDSIAEFLYFQYTETNLVENETVRKSYTAFMDELTEALGYDKEVWSEEAASIEAKVNVAVSEYEKAAYIEGMKLGARVVMELCGVIEKIKH